MRRSESEPQGAYLARPEGSLEGSSAAGEPRQRQFEWRRMRPEGLTLSPADTIEGNLEPEAAETAAGHEHEGHDHAGHDHEGHDHAAHDHEGHNHGPVLNPECTREIVLDIPADEVSKAFSSVAANYRKYAKIPGFRAGKVPESVVRRRYGAEIRKEVIDSL